MRALLVLIALSLTACSGTPETRSDRLLQDQFVTVALTTENGRPKESLWRWEGPISVRFHGPGRFRPAVRDHAVQLGELAGTSVATDGDEANMIVSITPRRTGPACSSDAGSSEVANIDIRSNVSFAVIRRCIFRETTRSLGLTGYLDPRSGSRSDTIFVPNPTPDGLSDLDVMIVRVFYDRRLRHGMPRDEVLAVVPAIVAEVQSSAE